MPAEIRAELLQLCIRLRADSLVYRSEIGWLALALLDRKPLDQRLVEPVRIAIGELAPDRSQHLDRVLGR